MPHISRDNPCFYLTCVTKDRLPVFGSDPIKEIACQAIDEARRSAGTDSGITTPTSDCYGMKQC